MLAKSVNTETINTAATKISALGGDKALKFIKTQNLKFKLMQIYRNNRFNRELLEEYSEI